MQLIRLIPVAAPRRRGLTMVEMMITLVVSAILLAVAVPSMREFIARQRVMGIAKELATDLRYLRSMRAQRTDQLRIDFGSTADFTCYILYGRGGNFGSCNCTRVSEPVCDDVLNPPIELKTVVLPRSSGVTVESVPTRLTLDLSGMPTGGTTLAVAVAGGALGGTVRVTTSAVALPALCSVSGHGAALPDCL